jgi:hypothetical protein
MKSSMRTRRHLLAVAMCALAIPTVLPVHAASAAPAAPAAPAANLNWLLPTSGALFGAYSASEEGNTTRAARMTEFQNLVGRKIALDRVYHQWSDDFPDADDYWSRDQGHTLILSWGPANADGTGVTWADISAGTEDAIIDARAADIKAFAAPMIFVFHHEPNGVHQAGTPEEFIAAYRHIHDRFVADGVTNVLYGFVMFDTAFDTGTVDDYYPGDDVVDVVGVDAYNWYQCLGRNEPWDSLQTIIQSFHDFGVAHNKPMVIAEWGSDEDPADPNHKAQWITDAAATLKQWPDIKGIAYFHAGPPAPTCDWWVDSTPQSLAAFQALAADPYFNPPPPLVTVTSGPNSPSDDPTPAFTFSSNVPNTTFTCSADGGVALPCSSGYEYTGLLDGTHTATITGTDPASGETGYTTYTWTVDLTPPVVAITTAPPLVFNQNSALFRFSTGEPDSTYMCSLDGSAPASCPATMSYSGLADGAHTFSVTAYDPAGNASNPASWTWTVDTVAPVPTINSGPGSITSSKTATFTFGANEAIAVYKCSKDAGTYYTCTSPKTYTGVIDGAHSFAVTATDLAGNVSAPVTYNWTVDSTKPSITLTQGPVSPTRDPSAAFSFTVTDQTATTSTCQLDGGTATPCVPGTSGVVTDSFNRTVANGWGTSPFGSAWTTSGTASDYAVNGSGATMNVATTNVARLAYLPQSWGDQDILVRFQINRMPTTQRVLAHVLGRYNPADGSYYTIRGSLVYDGSLKLDASKKPAVGAEATIGTVFSQPGQAAANTWYWLRGDFSNVGSSVLIRGKIWKDGTAEPATWQYSYTDSSAPLTRAGRPGLRTMAWATDVPFTVTYDDFAATTGTTYTNLADGSHSEVISATDAAGNVASSTYTWTVDTVPPVVTITSGPTNPSGSTSATFKFSSNEGGTTFTCTMDGGTPAACTSPITYSSLAAGSHTFAVTGTDGAGNVAAPVTWTWTITTTLPTVTITSGPPALTNSKTATFVFTSSDPNATLWCSKDGGTYYACTSPKTYTLLADGAHTESIYAKNTAGQGPAATWNWTVDTTAPKVTVTGTPPNPSTSGTATFTFTASEPNVTFTCQLDSNAAATCTSPITYTNIVIGWHTWKVYATDQAGNVGTTVTYKWQRVS